MNGGGLQQMVRPRPRTLGVTHWVTGSVALLVSLGVHILLGVWLADREITLSVRWTEPVRALREFPPMAIDRVLQPTSDDQAAPGEAGGLPASGMERLPLPVEAIHSLPPAHLMTPPVAGDPSGGEDGALQQPLRELPGSANWLPREEILVIEQAVVQDELPELERRRIARTPRRVGAPDIAFSLARPSPARRGEAVLPVSPAGIAAPEQPAWREPEAVVSEIAAAEGARKELDALDQSIEKELLPERTDEVTPLQPIEGMLTARMEVYRRFFDRRYVYFRLELERAGASILPVMPKDLLLVQHRSARMGTQRMHFCREGLLRSLSWLNEDDRFNVLAFSDVFIRSFPEWQPVTEETQAEAGRFIENLFAEGNTDLFGSLNHVLDIPRSAGRPAIAVMTTDGIPTAGLVESTDIIGEFTRLNRGRWSLFTVAIMQRANLYLLDLISYSNRGDVRLVTRGRWEIPDAMEDVMRQVSRPVLGDLTFRFPYADEVEIYPVQTSNLYLDRPMVLYGRLPRDQDFLLFQAVGQGRERRCDMLFELAVEDADEGEKTLREDWARQKIYHLIGEYARRPSDGLRDKIEQTARSYRIDIPHRGRF